MGCPLCVVARGHELAVRVLFVIQGGLMLM